MLGAGIMGSSTALFLARGGCAVTLIDRAAAPMAAASRWNEGKIHLGFLYSADPSTRTAAELIAGGLAFKPLTEGLIGRSIDAAVTGEDEIYLLHPQSVVGLAAMERYFGEVEAMLAGRSRETYLGPITPVRRLDDSLVAALGHGSIEAGFRVPERSVRTGWISDRFVDAVRAEPLITLLSGTSVVASRPAGSSSQGPGG